MRWYILKTLLHKEALRHATNRGGLMLAGLLVTASLVLSAMNPAGEQSNVLVGGVRLCFIHIEEDQGPWASHLRASVPAELKNHIRFNKLDANLGPDRTIVYPPGAGAIQVRTASPSADGNPRYGVWLWHPTGDRAGMTIYEQWFWRESYRFFHQQAADELKKTGVDSTKAFPLPDLDSDGLWENRILIEHLRDRFIAARGAASTPSLPDVELKEKALSGSALDMRAAIATALVMFALFFTCVYMMPSLTCEERERGLLLAQALSPARAREILAAKFLFYPTFGIMLATLLAGIHNPNVLTRPFFWLALLSLALGSLGIGMSIASLARTQRSASLAALCYMLVVALVLVICQQNNIPYLPDLFVESHAPLILHATLTNQTRPYHWINLLECGVLAVIWVGVAGFLFRKRGWQ